MLEREMIVLILLGLVVLSILIERMEDIKDHEEQRKVEREFINALEAATESYMLESDGLKERVNSIRRSTETMIGYTEMLEEQNSLLRKMLGAAEQEHMQRR